MNEMSALAQKTRNVCQRVEAALKQFDPKRSIQFLGLSDKYRLTVLLVWEERYGIPVEWMVQRLFDFYSKHRRGGKYSGRRGLPVRVNAFVSKISQEYIKALMAAETMASRQLELKRQAVVEQKVAQQMGPREPLYWYDAESLDEYSREYRQRMDKERRLRETLVNEIRLRSKPYRGSGISVYVPSISG